MTFEELRIAIETYPHRLFVAMEEVAKAEQAIEKLSAQIEEEEAALSPDPPEAAPDENTQEAIINLDYELALFNLHKAQVEGEIELTYRNSPPSGLKLTEGLITSLMNSDSRVIEVRKSYLEKKLARDLANISRRAEYSAVQAPQEPVTSSKLEKLRERLATAEIALAGAEMKLEEVKASIEPYRLLVQLYTAGLIK